MAYLDLQEGARTLDRGYLCSGCIRLLWGPRYPTERECIRFIADPDEIYRLERRVKDLEAIVIAFAEKAAVCPEKESA